MSQSNMTVREIISEIRRQLDEALTIAEAAEVCALDGHIDRAFHISLDMEDLLHSTKRARLTECRKRKPRTKG